MAGRSLPRKVHDSTKPTVVPSHPDALACLGDRDGWDATPGGNGWTHTKLDVTVVRNSTYEFEVRHAGGNRYATSATGALCIVDQIIAARAAV